MSHKLWRLRESLYNTPLLVNTETFNSVINYLDSRNNSEVKVEKTAAIDDDGSEYRNFIYNADNATAVMYIEGPLSYRPVTVMGFDCGGVSYTQLKEDVEDAISLGAKTIVFSVDSGGGEAHGMIDSAQYIRGLLDQNDVKLISFIDGMSCSAAYGLTAISDEVITSADSQIGSIGVLIQLSNISKQLEMEGVERTFITAGSSKVPFEDDGSFRQGFLDDLQKSVNETYERFTGHVAQSRNMSVESVKSTEAKVFSADEAVQLGLADRVMTPESFYEYLAEKAQSNMENTPVNVNRIFKFAKNEEVTQTMNLEEIQTQLTAALTEKSEMAAQLETLMSEKETFAELLTSLQASKEAAETELATFKQDTKLTSRKAALASAKVNAEVAQSIVTATASLDEEAFGIVLKGYATQTAAIEQSDLMQELGGMSAEVEQDADKVLDANQIALQRFLSTKNRK